MIQLLQERGHEVIEQQLPREMLYLADEVFMTGTAAEVTPVRSIDKIDVGEGRRGPVTAQLQEIGRRGQRVVVLARRQDARRIG